MFGTVREHFAAFLTPMEGNVECMYKDRLGLVTVGIGNKIDSPRAAWETRLYGAPFVLKSDQSVEAGQHQVNTEWQRVKDDTALTGDPQAARDTAQLVLTPQGVLDLLDGKLTETERGLRTHPAFARLDEWPADAQLALMSMAWAMGAWFAHGDRWPRFSASVQADPPDWLGVAVNCNMEDSWMTRRNAVHRGLFRNAAWAAAGDRAFDALYVAIPGRRPTLELGWSDADAEGQGFDTENPVSELQWFLAFLGFYDGEADGVFDAPTDKAVRAFQHFEAALPHNAGFGVDGKVGPMTWAALGYVVGD